MENIFETYITAHPKSWKLHERALNVFAAEGATHFNRILFPFLPYITHAKGSRKWDIDGNEYIDYLMGHGALILGHGHPDVVKAVQEQAALGTHFSSNHELERQWAELILEMIPWAEKVEFFSSGMEANMMALRLGRIYTGRNSVLKFEEHFHGWSDHLVEAGEPGVMPEDNMINTIAIPANDLDRLEQALATKKFAVLMTEGDAHAAQGDGEACISAIETAMAEAILQFVVNKEMTLERPMAETPTHWIAMGFHKDLNAAVKIALRDAIHFIANKTGLNLMDAYSLASLAVDLRVTQIVNANKGIHAMISKEIIKQ